MCHPAQQLFGAKQRAHVGEQHRVVLQDERKRLLSSQEQVVRPRVTHSTSQLPRRERATIARNRANIICAPTPFFRREDISTNRLDDHNLFEAESGQVSEDARPSLVRLAQIDDKNAATQYRLPPFRRAFTRCQHARQALRSDLRAEQHPHQDDPPPDPAGKADTIRPNKRYGKSLAIYETRMPIPEAQTSSTASAPTHLTQRAENLLISITLAHHPSNLQNHQLQATLLRASSPAGRADGEELLHPRA